MPKTNQGGQDKGTLARADITRAREKLGYKPSVSFKEALRELALGSGWLRVTKKSSGLHGPLFYLSGTCFRTPAFAYGRSTLRFGSGWAAVNGWRGDTNLNERIRFDLELMMQRTACITLRAAQEALSVWSRGRPISVRCSGLRFTGSADRALVAAFRRVYHAAHVRAE